MGSVCEMARSRRRTTTTLMESPRRATRSLRRPRTSRRCGTRPRGARSASVSCAAAPRWNRHATDSKQAETRAPSTHPHAVDAVARGHALSKAGTTKRYNRTPLLNSPAASAPRSSAPAGRRGRRSRSRPRCPPRRPRSARSRRARWTPGSYRRSTSPAPRPSSPRRRT